MVEEPHHNTYDIEFWGPDGMCTSFYLGALQAAVLMGKALGDEVPLYAELLASGLRQAESELFNGEYFIQRIEWKNLRAKSPLENKSMVGSYSPEAVAIFEKEGPKYQYGNGCLADGVLGAWLALVCGVGQVLDGAEGRQPSAGGAQIQSQAPTSPTSPIRSGPPTPAAPKAGCSSAPGPRAASCRCLSSIPTKSGPASNTRSPPT